MPYTKTPKTKTEELLPVLLDWAEADLLELKTAVIALIEAGQTDPITTGLEELSDQVAHSACQTPRAGNGYFELKYIKTGAKKKRHGPYLYFRYRQGGRLKSVYKGKVNQNT
jgi:hypothetical protein